MTTLLLLWALTGGALATWLMMHIWLPDPPPDIYGRFAAILIAGFIGGIAGGYLVQGLFSSNPMPGLVSVVAAGAGGLILSGAVAFLGAAKRG